MKERTKAETESFYRELLAEQQRSGQSIREFARQRGVPAGTLSCWGHQIRKRDAARRKAKRDAERRRERKKEQAQATGSPFVPVSVIDAASASPVTTSFVGSYEVELGGGRVLRLPPDFDDRRVAALVRAVVSC